MHIYQSYNDEQLLQLLKTGDETAFRIIFERYRDRIFYYLLKHTKSAVVAEEIVTDVFMKLWEGRELSGHIRELPAFLHKVSYYKAIDFLKTVARQQRLQQVYIDRAATATRQNADDRLMDGEIKKLILEAVNQLPPQRKLIYKLSREEGLTHEQIAKALHLSSSTVNNAIGSATRSISKYLHARLEGRVALSVFFIL
ncbi:MAG: sigma-70 family RNA polymerase sigma factor [Niabella sp.]